MKFDLTGLLDAKRFKEELANAEDLRPSEIHACLLYAAHLIARQDKLIRQLIERLTPPGIGTIEEAIQKMKETTYV